MDWQEFVALAIVVLTAAAFAWSKLRPRRFSFKHETHCGCSSVAQEAARHSIVFHARKGEQPRVTVKMK